MASLEVYEKLRKEILSLIEGDILDDDEFFSLISASEDSRRVSDLAHELKEKGNTLFKQGCMDDSLKQYGFAQLILARYHFEKESDRIEFLKLAIRILMNSVVCLSKKKEFVQVGQICSIVLEFDPNNVKAMFKRAVAAIELGKHDWAKLDLLMAAKIDPNNKEVIKKLEEVKNSAHKNSPKNHPFQEPKWITNRSSYSEKEGNNKFHNREQTEGKSITNNQLYHYYRASTKGYGRKRG